MYLTFEDIVEEALKPLKPISIILPLASIDESQNASDRIWPIEHLEGLQSRIVDYNSSSSTQSIEDSIWSIQSLVESQNATIWPTRDLEEVQNSSDSMSSIVYLEELENASDSNWSVRPIEEGAQAGECIQILLKNEEWQTGESIEEAENASNWYIRSVEEEPHASDIIQIQSINKESQAIEDIKTQSIKAPENFSNTMSLQSTIQAAQKIDDVMHPNSTKKTKNIRDSILRIKSKDKYFNAYENFVQWKETKKISSFSENTFLTYFYERSKRFKPPSLWSTYTMLRSAMMFKNGIDIKKYHMLLDFLKMQGYGYKPKKTKVLTATDVERFLNNAPDKIFLVTKVALLFGITGACGRADLAYITTEDVETHDNIIQVKIRNTKTQIPRTFSIHGKFCNIVKKYQSIRSMRVDTSSNRFFLNFRNGKCTAQNIGINKFGVMPKEIALYLNLPEPELYTGHSFKSTSSSLLPQKTSQALPKSIKP